MTDKLTAAAALAEWLQYSYLVLKVVIGFSIIIFVHELGHFLAAKWMDVRVDRFAVGFFYRLCGYRRGEGFTFGPRPNFKPEELAAKGYGETDYCLNALPFGGYVRMLGEDDILIDEQTGAMQKSSDPRAFTNKSVSRRLVVVSAGVVFNVAFAALLYALVYLAGSKQVWAPVLGRLDLNSPAAKAGLLSGDRILSVNGAAVQSFDDVAKRCILADGALRVRVERGGEPLEREFDVARSDADKENAPLAGLLPTLTTTLSEAVAANPQRRDLRPGDRVTAVDGQPIDDMFQVVVAFEGCAGRPVTMTVERPRGDGAAPETETVTASEWPVLRVGAMDAEDASASGAADLADLLGFHRRRMILEVIPGWPGAAAGFQVGDVLVQWDTVATPLFRDVTASTDAGEGRATPVIVERDGRLVTLTVTPRRGFSVTKAAPPRVGLGFGEELLRPVVADVRPGTPAAELGMPRGAELLAIGARDVHNWLDVLEGLKTAAGTTVEVRYRSGADQITGRMSVPGSMVNELDLPATARIRSIAGEDAVTLDDGRRVVLPSPRAVRKLLEKHVGQTVPVEFARSIIDQRPETRAFAVRADNVNPWQMRFSYEFDMPELGPHFTRRMMAVTAGGNPLRALGMGLGQAGDDLLDVYRIMQTLVKNTLTRQRGAVSVKNVSGPLQIISAAVDRARAGFGDLAFFLAYISANLAVLNLLPIPVVDGGMIVFLLLERLRGKPVSIKVQIVATLTGLGLIVLSFVFVTLQDIVKWWGGSM